ncbi:MAG: hypothetical protein Q9166_005711 [cf. Caloplaca sp. 2 TL-2023]
MRARSMFDSGSEQHKRLDNLIKLAVAGFVTDGEGDRLFSTKGPHVMEKLNSAMEGLENLGIECKEFEDVMRKVLSGPLVNTQVFHPKIMPASIQSQQQPMLERVPDNGFIAYFMTSAGGRQQYMTFDSGFSQLTTLIRVRSRFQNKPSLRNYLDKNVQEVVLSFIVERRENPSIETDCLPSVMEKIHAAHQHFRNLGIEAKELQKMAAYILEIIEETGYEGICLMP